jgi:hypothetical protein
VSKPGEFVELHETAKATLYGTRAEGNNTSEEKRRAALRVCANATDVEDAEMLLRALGLLEPGFSWCQSSRNRRKKVTK